MPVVGLAVSADGNLLLGGARFRNIGVKWPTAIVNFYSQPGGTTAAGTCLYTSAAQQDAGLDFMKSMGVKVILVSAFPFYPNQWRSGVLNGKAWNVATSVDRDLHYAYVDAFLTRCKAKGIGVVFTLFFRWPSVPDLVGNNVRQWLVGGGNTRTFATTITQEIVTRYTAGTRSDLADTVFGWQFSGEVNHVNDISSASMAAGTSAFTINTSYGTAASYSQVNDALVTGGPYGSSELSQVLAWWSGVVTAIDSQRLVLTGNGSNSYWQPGGVNGISNPLQNLIAEFSRDNPTNGAQVHFYGGIGYCSPNGRAFDSLLTAFRSAAARRGKAFVLGEYGNQPRHVASLANNGSGTITATINENWAVEQGDVVRLVGTGTAWDTDYTVIAVPSQTGPATLQASTRVPAGSISSGLLLVNVSQFARMTAAIVASGCDLAFAWCYCEDSNIERGQPINDPANAYQPAVLKAANAALSL